MLDVLRCRCKHLTHQEAASELGIRLSTVHRYQANTLDHLRLHGGRNALAQWLANEYATWEALQA